ncbi:ATP-binding protein [Amazonocrinis nigriterrae]|nr:ATP-binding protein [Amazonocrinis nigriterrae]
MFKPATKSQIKIRLALSGASGSGKTFSALAIAQHLGDNIALIDSERGSASRYADRFTFDTCELNDHHPAKYIEAIKAAESAGYQVIIIDSLSHAWFSELDLAGGRFDGWKNVRPLERKLIDAMIGSSSHIIATMRSKTEWIMEEYTAKDGKTKQSPKKIGTAPIQSSGIEYEFDIAGELDYNHILTISKSRCPELADKTFLNPGKEIADTLKAWIGQPQQPQPAPPWKLWKSQEDAITWASEQLPDWDIDAIQEEFNELSPNNGKKAIAWVERVNALKNQDF